MSAKNEAPLKGLLRLRDEMADLVTIQVTAFPQDGIYSHPDNEDLFERALQLGADCVGGIPHYEPTAELGLREVHRVFELAKQYGRRIDVHCDETDDPNSRFLEVMADNTVQHGLSGRVTASHCTAMGSYEPYYSSKLHGFLQARGDQHRRQPVRELADPGPARRLPEAARLRAAEGAARRRRQRLARQRRDHGPVVPAGPRRHGRSGLARAPLHLHERPGRDPRDARAARPTRGARTLGIEDEYGLEEGKPADCVVFDAPSAIEVLRLHPPRRWVVRRGRVIAETEPSRTTLLGEPVTFTP